MKLETVKIKKNDSKGGLIIEFKQCSGKITTMVIDDYSHITEIVRLNLEYINRLDLYDQTVAYILYDFDKKSLMIRYMYNVNVNRVTNIIKESDAIWYEWWEFLQPLLDKYNLEK